MPRHGISQAGMFVIGENFATTQWGLVAAAAAPTSAESRAALQRLFELYWLPVYACIRRSGFSPDEAEDLVQAFFLMLLETKTIRRADPHRGRFRSYLLGSLKHFLASELTRGNAQKRGGRERIVSLDLATAEGKLQNEPSHDQTPEKTFERQWALSVLDAAMTRLRKHYKNRGQESTFEALSRFLDHSDPPDGYGVIAIKLGKSDAALRVTVHRLRHEYGRLLRELIVGTVSSPDEVDDEIKHLFSALQA